MRLFLFIICLLLSSFTFSGKWRAALKEQGIKKANICGNHLILNTKKSINKNFIVKGEGYLFSNLIKYQDYWSILKKYNKEEASIQLRKKFKNTTLWRILDDEKVENLGTPKEVIIHFKSTIKDCYEGAKTTLGKDCSKMRDKKTCCSEKFIGPSIEWIVGGKKYTLNYTPDPSVRLKTPKRSYYCHSIKQLKI